MSTGRVFIFANGEALNAEIVPEMIRPGDFLIAADNGLRFLRRLGLQPNLVIGDLDSLDPREIELLEHAAVRVERHPVDKDETDLELAVIAALRERPAFIRIVAALGGRLDMTLANIFLLGLPELHSLDVRLEDGFEEVFLIRPGQPGGSIHGRPGEVVSLLPLGGPAGGVRTAGLVYPLRGETLYPERTRGISNRLVGTDARITLETGQLICIHTRRPANE